MTRPKLRVAARDPGAANLLAPMIREAALTGYCDIDIWITENIAAYFADTPHPVRRFPAPPALDALRALWKAEPADALLTGTSHYEAYDSLLWTVARENGVPSLAAVDFWSNTARRFLEGMPDRIGVIDAEQAEEARVAGLAPAIITGHPGLAAISELPAREETGPLEVVFFSERIADDVAEGVNPDFGFDETTACRLVIEAAAEAARQGVPVNLTVKFHPYNDPASFRTRLGAFEEPAGLTVSWIEERMPVAEVVAGTDLVTGMVSIAMVESALMGRPVVSVQPGLCRENIFIPGLRGYADTLTEPAQAFTRLVELMTEPAARREATERLAGFRRSIRPATGSPVRDWMITELGTAAA
jgi:hypothetical protein